eukprot:gene20029-124_t
MGRALKTSGGGLKPSSIFCRSLWETACRAQDPGHSGLIKFHQFQRICINSLEVYVDKYDVSQFVTQQAFQGFGPTDDLINYLEVINEKNSILDDWKYTVQNTKNTQKLHALSRATTALVTKNTKSFSHRKLNFRPKMALFPIPSGR